MEEVLLFSTVLVPIILALVEVVKKATEVPTKYTTIISLFIGLVIGAISSTFTDLDLVSRLWSGGLAGLSATGLFEILKTRESDKEK